MFKGGFLRTTNGDDKEKNEPWQARPPPAVLPRYSREITRPLSFEIPEPEAQAKAPPAFNDRYRALTSEECVLLGLSADYAENIEPYQVEQEGVRFLDWEEMGGKRIAVFRVENEEHPLGYHFSRMRYGEVRFAGLLSAIVARPEADLQALRAFHDRFGEPTKGDLEEAEVFLFGRDDGKSEPSP